MGFTEDIIKLSEQVRKRFDQVVGEEATKMALIVPFLSSDVTKQKQPSTKYSYQM
ncbi:hypothetical protein [Nostoc sp.]|uniref:hypothetical protein n=1 Tax=Nostoc sp. TaxID=1180 RepID=UPI002FF77871